MSRYLYININALKNKFLLNTNNRPSYKQLLEDLKNIRFYTKIGKKYNVSDNCIRKWLHLYKKYDIKTN